METEKITRFSPREREQIGKALSLLEERSSAAGSGSGAADGRAAARLRLIDLLIDINLDAPSVIAALVADLPREGIAREEIARETIAPEKIPPEKLAELFGGEVVSLLAGLEKISRLSGKSNTLHEAVIIRNMLFVMADDYRVILIMLAKKLDTLRTRPDSPGFLPANELRELARECVNVYAPLAVRLGISWIKDELEDLSLKILNREIYQQIKDLVAAKRAERNALLSVAEEAIRNAAGKAGINIDAASRAKHFYSIYMKMRRRNKSAGEIFDLFGIRIICDNTEQCYTLLGIVHQLWKPVDGNFKDYIAKPKPNGYRSLHTAVIIAGEENPYAEERGAEEPGHAAEERFLEIQIRTREMHHVAENGVASHWLYKRGAASEITRRDASPHDVSPREASPREISRRENSAGESPADGESGPGGESDNTGAAGGSVSWFDDIKREITKKSVYVFTPQGKVIELPAGSTPIDFAYRIHTAVAEHCTGAKADGSIIPLYSELKNTQTIEILTGALARPTVNWLEAAKTSRARAKIRSWLEKHTDFAATEKAAEKTAAARNIAARSIAARKKTPVTPAAETPRMEMPPVLQVVQGAGAEGFSVRIANEKNMMVRFARCCHPVAGDPVTGYISRGRGIIIHRENCRNLANIPDIAERTIKAEWENSVSTVIKRFRVKARFQANLFSEIESAARKYQGHLLEGRLEKSGGAALTGFFAVRFEDEGALKSAMKKIRAIPGITGLTPLS